MKVIFFGCQDGITDEPLYYSEKDKRWRPREFATVYDMDQIGTFPEGACFLEVVGGPRDGEVLEPLEFIELRLKLS